MMRLTRVVALAVMAASAGVGALHAQSLRDAQAPAEFPPASYTGAQYVDSKGCVYVRAGIDQNVTWVPRVDRQRRLICGQTPTLSASAAQAARTAPQASANTSRVEQITVPAPAAPAPRRTTTAAATLAPVVAPQPTPRPVVTRRTAAPKPATRVVVRRPAPAPVPVARQSVAAPSAPASACPDAASITSQAISDGCVPAPTTRVLPRHVYDARLQQDAFQVPEGYQPAWNDDRLNPRRAEQNLAGIARTRLIWTNTVPRRLIDRQTGRDVTTKVALVYPFTDEATQQRDLGTVTLVQRNDGRLMKRIVRNKSKARAPVALSKAAPANSTTRAVPAKTTGAKRYVQVGTYGVPANAKAAAQRIARAGLPARLGKLTRSGKTYQIVLAGPFTSSADLSAGLKRSRAMGFGDAFVRK